MDVLPFRSRALCHGRGDCCLKDGSAPQGVETISYLFGSLVLRRATACRASCLECWVLSQLASDAGALPCARTSRG